MEIRMPIMMGQHMAMLATENDITQQYIRPADFAQWLGENLVIKRSGHRSPSPDDPIY
jgi:hypothetical protein